MPGESLPGNAPIIKILVSSGPAISIHARSDGGNP